MGITTEKLEVDINPEYTMLKKVNNNLYLSQEQIDILESYNLNYQKCQNLKDLIYLLMDVIEENDDDILDNLLSVLSERDYYENYNK